MKIEWDKKNSHDALVKELRPKLSLKQNGRVSYKIGVGVDFFIDALFRKVIHSYSLDHEFLYEKFKDSVISTFQKNKLSRPDDILLEFKKRCDQSLRNKKKFILLTSISLNNIYLPKRRKVNGCTVSFSKNIPAKYVKARKNLISNFSSLELSEQEEYLFVTVSVEAPNTKTAFIRAIGALDVIRAIWQIGFQKSTFPFPVMKGSQYPTDSIISLGQAHTLHKENGNQACEILWYEPDFKKVEVTNVKDFNLTDSRSTTDLQRLRKNPFKDHVYNSLKSYIHALDHDDQEFRFMKLWTTLEGIVNTDESTMTIRRVSFFYKDRALNKEILNSLRVARNINAHRGVKPFNVEMKNFILCQYIDHLLGFFINNCFKHKGLNQVIDLISLPTELQTINEQIKQLCAVKKFIGVA